MLMCAQTHGCAYVQPHTPTHTYVYTPMYAHTRTYTRTRRSFSDTKSAFQHCQTEFHHHSDTIHFYYPITVQTNLYWNHIDCIICTNCCHLSSIITHLPFISNYLPTIHHHSSISITHLSIYLPFIITVSHHLARIIFHLYLISSPTNLPSYQYVSLL